MSHLATATAARRRTTQLSFFGRDSNKGEEEKEPMKGVEDKSDNDREEKFSFFGLLKKRGDRKQATSDAADTDSGSATAAATTTNAATATHDPPASSPLPQPVQPSPPAPELLTPSERAARLKSEAERMRLEAERMDAELTLRKIERLEKELTAAKAADSKSSSKKDVDQLQREINMLLNKVQGVEGGSTNGATATAETANATAAGSTATTTTKDTDIFGSSLITKPVWPEFTKPYVQEEYDELYKTLKDLPQMFLGAAALMVEVKAAKDPETGKTLVNATELAIAFDKNRRLDFSYSSKSPPKFTKAQIAAQAETLVNLPSRTGLGGLFDGQSGSGGILVDSPFEEPRFQELLKENPEKMAQLMLEYEYYSDQDEEQLAEGVNNVIAIAGDNEILSGLLGGIVNGTLPTALDSTIDGLYPKCTTKKDSKETAKKQPTEAQVRQLVKVLPKADFMASSKLESVQGGYIVRGLTSIESGDEFIAKLDQVMERSDLKDKMTVLYAADFTALAEEEENYSPWDTETPILYVVGPEICREPRPVQLAIVSGFGLATTWYLSIFPFLLNPAVATRVDEQLALADAGMTPDLAFLTDLSVPLFATFVAIQLVHEMAHLIAAGANGVC